MLRAEKKKAAERKKARPLPACGIGALSSRPRLDDTLRVASAPDSVWHMPDWCTAVEEASLLAAAARRASCPSSRLV